MITRDILERITQFETLPSDQLVTPPPEIVAFFVQWVRGLKQWKQSTLANFAGLSISTIERVERGEKVSDESLDRIADALGYSRGYFTTPRRRRSEAEAMAAIAEVWGELEPVNVRPLNTQNQVRQIAHCHAFLIHRPGVDDRYDEEIAALTEWCDLASFIINAPLAPVAEEGRRRELYNSILACVQHLERQGLTILSGVMDAPQEGLPDWKIAVVSITQKRTDPGALKRRVVFVDRRCVVLREIRSEDLE